MMKNKQGANAKEDQGRISFGGQGLINHKQACQNENYNPNRKSPICWSKSGGVNSCNVAWMVMEVSRSIENAYNNYNNPRNDISNNQQQSRK